MIIDIDTLFLGIIIVGIVIASILTIVGLGVDRSLLYWAAGYGVSSLAYLLISLRGSIPDLISITIANAILVTTYALFTHGLLRFLNRKLPLLLIWAPVPVILTTFPFLYHSVEARIVISGTVTAAQSLALASILIANNSQMIGRGKFILMTAFLLGAAVAASRPVAILMGVEDINAFNSAGLVQSLTFLPLAALHVALALGLVLMQKEHAEAATDSIARSDDLTGLPNRRRLYERITQFLAHRNGHREYGALMLIDLDNFKSLNDEHGHPVGDEILRQAAKRIAACTGSKDMTARLGGDEFVVLLTGLGTDQRSAMNSARHTSERIAASLCEPYSLDQGSVQTSENRYIDHRCSGSVGVTMIPPDMSDRELLMREADRAMYRAKNHAKGTVSLNPMESPDLASA